MLLCSIPLGAFSKSYVLNSPDGLNRLTVMEEDGKLSFTLHRGGLLQFTSVPLSMQAGERCWGREDRVRKVSRNEVDGQVDFTVPRRFASMRNRYNSMILELKDCALEFRAYDDGVAYRFVGRRGGMLPFNETGGYRFPEDVSTCALLTSELQNWFEEDYTEAPLSALPSDKLCINPLMVRTANSILLFADADLYNYPGSYLRPCGNGLDLVLAGYPSKEEYFDGTNKLYAAERFDYVVKCDAARSFPWRVVGTFEKETELLTSELIYLLSTPATADFSWINPGKVLWDWWNNNNIYGVDFKAGINTATYKYMVDYAAVHGFEYILIDEGWSAKDSLLELNPQTDIPQICRYAGEKGVGVCLWAKWINVDRQMDEAFALMASWGVKGVKIDFMDRNDAKMVNFYEAVAAKAAEYHMLVDFHGSYPNEGMRAKWPNLMTREGVLGLEYNKWSDRATPRHQLIVPFLRQWLGPMDYTPGSMLNAQPECFRSVNQEPMSQGTRCHQMAMYVVYESPLQMLSDSPSKYDENPLWLPFLEKVPTVWDETLPLWGEFGRKIAVVRRSGDLYYIGAMCAGEGFEAELSLDFLPEGEWNITAYSDGLNASKNAKDYTLEHLKATSGDVLKLNFAPNGGFVAIIEKPKY